ncbi:MAG: DNA polymerase III subunit delta [Dysgonamonadaceae bacterium]|jgi:DNA polymerase-3 subunit delta|nr:DNA polymerase III subunit delta [Dysgonamonadaceae bacterium]
MAKELNFEDIKRSIIAGQFASIYLLQGEEEYFIDRLTDEIINNALKDEERDFNQIIFYGADASPEAVIGACKRFPLMSERQLVVLKEAQNMKNKDIEELVFYVSKPLTSTIFVICYKHGKLDGRKKLPSEISKKGIVFESKRLYDNQITPFICTYIKSRNLRIEDSAAQLMADSLGANVSKLVNEIEKLIITLPAKSTITSSLIEENIGISKDFNNFELQRAIAKRDVLKANRIAKYFDNNPKNNPLVLSLTVLFNFFANLMICHYENDKSLGAIKTTLGLRFDMQGYDYVDGLKNYNAFQTMQIISLIRETDARSKGFNSSLSDGALLKELLFRVMH